MKKIKWRNLRNLEEKKIKKIFNKKIMKKIFNKKKMKNF
jgi:hypothetical protein